MNKKALRKAALGIKTEKDYYYIEIDWSRANAERKGEIFAWLKETLGPEGRYISGAQYPCGNPPYRWMLDSSGYKVLILREDDVIAYRLRWG